MDAFEGVHPVREIRAGVLCLDKEADRHYAEIRSELDRLGTPIGPNDLLIAAHARALDLIVEEYARVPGLSIENWLA